MKQPSRISYTKDARRDLDHCRQFLRHHSRSSTRRRTREFFDAIRRIAENPELSPVRTIDSDTGLHLRRCNVAQFVIVYVYFPPSAREPAGLVSLRAFRHGRTENVLWRVRENTSEYVDITFTLTAGRPMSTKATLAQDDSFHFYHDMFDEDHVYLELRTSQFEARHGRIMLPIPLHIWETIRHLGAPDLSLIDRTDEELRRTVETEVDRRIAAYRVKTESDPGASFVRYVGMLVYGTADSPREKQIETGMLYFVEERERQRQLCDAIEVLKRRSSTDPSRAANG
jgi:plasmid stabilization system protein ParE